MIPVLRPDLPSPEELSPYLHQIYISGIASNGGPLVRELENLLGGVAVANGTLGLELACQYAFAQKVRVPAFTFPATATAVLRAGLEVVWCDVREDTWAVEPDPQTLAVCPFGFPAEGVLVDAAGAYNIQTNGNRVVSFHATKPLPAGEGGMVFGVEELLDHVRRAREFGREGDVVTGQGTNAKMSEYHAAVALASLKKYPATTEKRRDIAAHYLRNLAGTVGMRPFVGGSVFPILIDDPAGVMKALAIAGYESRRWYWPTLDLHPAFKACKSESLPVTRRLAGRLLCLPFHTFLTTTHVDEICGVVCGC